MSRIAATMSRSCATALRLASSFHRLRQHSTEQTNRLKRLAQVMTWPRLCKSVTSGDWRNRPPPWPSGAAAPPAYGSVMSRTAASAMVPSGHLYRAEADLQRDLAPISAVSPRTSRCSPIARRRGLAK